MHVWLSDGQNSQICTTFPVIKCVFFKSLRVKCVLRHFLVHRFLLPRYTLMWAWHVPVYAEAQCCFKSFALRSCQCGRKTRYGLEFWSLDLLSARVNFLGRVPALLAKTLLATTVCFICVWWLMDQTGTVQPTWLRNTNTHPWPSEKWYSSSYCKPYTWVHWYEMTHDNVENCILTDIISY